jgi:hypothetical protein
MNVAHARIKRAVREAISECGGIDGASATAGRKRSVAGDWNNLNHDALPSLECSLALDEVSFARGNGAPILSAYAAEMNHVCVRLPEVTADGDQLSAALIDASAEFGDIAAAIREATRDGVIDAADREHILGEIDAAVRSIMSLRSVTAALGKGEGE